MGVDIDAIAKQHKIFAMPDRTKQPLITIVKVLMANPENKLYNDYMEYIIDRKVDWLTSDVFSNGYRQFDAINFALAQRVGGDIKLDEKENKMYFILPAKQRKHYSISNRTVDNFTAYLNTKKYIIPDMIDAILNLNNTMPAKFYDALDEKTKLAYGQLIYGLTIYQDYVLSISY